MLQWFCEGVRHRYWGQQNGLTAAGSATAKAWSACGAWAHSAPRRCRRRCPAAQSPRTPNPAKRASYMFMANVDCSAESLRRLGTFSAAPLPVSLSCGAKPLQSTTCTQAARDFDTCIRQSCHTQSSVRQPCAHHGMPELNTCSSWSGAALASQDINRRRSRCGQERTWREDGSPHFLSVMCGSMVLSSHCGFLRCLWPRCSRICFPARR